MKKVFVVDTDAAFQNSVRSLCSERKDIEVSVYDSGMQIFSELKNGQRPVLMFVNLELADMNEFMLRDLLKKASADPQVPVLFSYAPQTEADLPKYQSIKLDHDGFYKKPLSEDVLRSFLSKYLGEAGGGAQSVVEMSPPEVEDDVVFTEVTPGAGLELRLTSELNAEFNKDIDDIKTTPEPTEEKKSSGVVFNVSDADSDVGMLNKTTKELTERLVSLQKQDKFLRNENKQLHEDVKRLEDQLKQAGPSGAMAELENKNTTLKQEITLKDEALAILQRDLEGSRKKEQVLLKDLETERSQLASSGDVLKQRIAQLEEEKRELTVQTEELSNKLTDKERELVAKNHEFEKDLMSKTDDLLQKNEERLIAEFKEKEAQLLLSVGRLENERTRREAEYNDEVNRYQDLITQLKDDIQQLKEAENNLNNSVAQVQDEKASLSKMLATMEDNQSSLERERDTLIQRLKCSEEDLAEEKKEKENLSQTLLTNEEQLAAIQKERDVLTGKVTVVEDDLANIKKEKDSISQILAATEESFSRVESEKQELNQKMTEVEETISRLTKDKEDLTQKLEDARETISTLENEKEEAAGELNNAMETVARLKKEKEEESEKAAAEQQKIASIADEFKEKENRLLASIEKLSIDLESEKNKAEAGRTRMQELEELLMRAVKMTRMDSE